MDSFDTDRISGSIQYDDDNIPQPVMEYATIRKDEKKSKKKEVTKKIKIIYFVFSSFKTTNDKQIQRQREKEEKKARKQEEKDRKKSQSRTRSATNERNVNTGSNNRSKARIIMLDDTEEYFDLGVSNIYVNE